MNNRRKVWLIQQQREKEHEIRKQKMTLEFELKRAAILRSNKGCSEKMLHQIRKENRRESRDHKRRDCNRPSASKTSVMSQKFKSYEGSTPKFQDPEGPKFSTTELRRIKVDIRRRIPGETDTSCELQHDIVAFEEITLKRRKDEGVKPIFDREELKLHSGTTNEEVEERRTVKMIDSERTGKANHSSRRLSSHEGSVRNIKSNHRRSCLNERDRSDFRDRSRGHERRHRSNDFAGHSSLHRSEIKSSLKRKSSHEGLHSVERKRNSHHNCSSQSDRDGKRYPESRGKSGEQRKREISLENPAKDGSRDGIMPALSYYIKQIPVPIPVPAYYGNFPPRPIMMDQMMPGGLWTRNNLPIRPRVPSPPWFMHPQMYGPRVPSSSRFMHPKMYRPRTVPSNSRFSRMF